MAHESTTGSSPIIKTLFEDLRSILPEADRATLDAYASRAEATSPQGDFHRARHCVAWAIAVAEDPSHSHLAGLLIRLKQVHEAWKDVFLGAEFGSEVETGLGSPSQEIEGHQKIGSGEDIEILWVGDAIEVAQGATEKSGWDSVPWEKLV